MLAAFGAGRGDARHAWSGAVTWLAVLPFAHLGIAHLWAMLYFGLGAAMILGFLGIMAGLWAEKFDHMAAVTNFVIMPMTFLSGTFYLVERLPEPFRTFSHFNPFFYLIDGFRYGFIGHAEGSLAIGVGDDRGPDAGAGLGLLLDVPDRLQDQDLRPPALRLRRIPAASRRAAGASSGPGGSGGRSRSAARPGPWTVRRPAAGLRARCTRRSMT